MGFALEINPSIVLFVEIFADKVLTLTKTVSTYGLDLKKWYPQTFWNPQSSMDSSGGPLNWNRAVFCGMRQGHFLQLTLRIKCSPYTHQNGEHLYDLVN